MEPESWEQIREKEWSPPPHGVNAALKNAAGGETLRPIRTQGHGKVSFSEEEVQMERNEMWKSLFLIPPTR